MTPEQIEAMAREAGIRPDNDLCGIAHVPAAAITRFAALVRANALEDAARVCEGKSEWYQATEGRKYPELRSDAETGADRCAVAIRAIKETP